jgi:hypothetical protein
MKEMRGRYEAQFGFPPGDGPFHARGHAYRRDLGFVDRCMDGAEAAVASIDDEAVRTFLDQPFLSTTWYDAMPLVALSEHAAALRHTSFEAHVEELAKHNAELDLAESHRFLLRLRSLDVVVQRLPRLICQSFSFVKAYVEPEGPGRAYIGFVHVPGPFLAYFRTIAVVASEVVLTHTGAVNARVEGITAEAAGMSHGVTVHQLEAHLCWDRPV